MSPNLQPMPLVLSAAGHGALRDRARRLSAHLRDHPELDRADVAHTLAATDAGLAHRAVVFGVDGLQALADGVPSAQVVSGVAAGDAGSGPVLVFSGHGSQWPGMAVALLDESPHFAA